MSAGRDTSGAYRARARRVRRFLLGVLLHALWWDLILNRPVLRRFRTDPMKRWCRIARRYRALAVELGGVLIKLGQFMSARLDVIPSQVAAELAELQDEVPPASFDAVRTRLEHDLGAPAEVVFAELDPAPLGAASLAQVHRAVLHDGREAVVKILRPDIESIVEIDLAAFADGTRWLKLWRRFRARVDIDWIHREFAAVTRRELDLSAEGRSAERFARDLGSDPTVRVPQVIWEHTGSGVLTMENVTGLKIADVDALEAAGVDRPELARRLYAIYMRQLFETHFVHADPHPGNLFVHPLEPDPDDSADRPGFRIAFVDFGMTTEIPERLRESLREFAIGLGTRDARRMVRSYVDAGTLLPDADLDRLVAAHEALLDRFWGVPLAEMRDVALAEGQELAREFGDLLLDAPIQLQADMVFALRAVGLLAGLCSQLDPTFDPWQETIPFARRFARDAAPGLLVGFGDLVQGLFRLPGRVERILDRAECGDLTVQATWSPTSARRVDALTRSVRRIVWSVAAASLLVSGSLLRGLAPADPLAPWLLGGAAIAAAFALLRR